MTDTPWEPPMAGTEVEQLLGALDRLRATFRWKADDLDADGLARTIGASSLTIGALLKHLALVEDHYSTGKLSGAPLGEPWSSITPPGWTGEDDWELESASGDSPADLYALHDGAVVRSRGRFDAAIAAGGLDAPVAAGGEQHASLRRLLLDLVEEYGRHTGHADLLREAVDGRTGEDPPPGWRPTRPSV